MTLNLNNSAAATRLHGVITLMLLVSTAARSENPLILENSGLQNTYRVTFDASFESGVLEILHDDDDRQTPHTRIPFSCRIDSTDAPEKERVLFSLGRTDFSFIPPTDPADPTISTTGLLFGRESNTPGLILAGWEYDAEGEAWTNSTIEFGTVPEKTAAFDLSRESLGGIRLTFTEEQVKEWITDPLYRSDESYEAATGEWLSEWICPALGLSIKMSADAEGTEPVVAGITIQGDSLLQTSRHLGIGATTEEIKIAYGDAVSPEESTEQELVVGSVFEGLIFSLGDDGKVSSVFLGQGSE